MKLITPEQQQGHFEATAWGTIKGAAISGAIAGPAYALLNRRSATWRALPLPAKAFAIVVVAVPTITITAEKAGEAYDRSQWTGVGKRELDAEAQRETERWEGLSTTERMTDFAKQNKYGLIAAGWGASMIGSFAMVSRNKTLTFSRKIVQARVYAQALTIAMVFIAAIASGTGKSETEYVTTRSNDHSWKNILEQEGYSKESLDGPSTSESANRSMRERAQQLKGASQIADPPKGAEQ